MNARRAFAILMALSAFGVSAGLALFAGYAIGRYEIGPFTFVRNVEKTVLRKTLESWAQGRRNSKTGPKRRSYKFTSIFLRLSGEGNVIPVARSGDGGGMTSFGDSVLLLTHEGRLFSARSADDIRELAIETPENGFSDYKHVAESERYRDYWHLFGFFRYNDILYFRNDNEHGLVVSYTEFDRTGICYRTAVAVLRFGLDVQDIEQLRVQKEDWDVIYRTHPCLPFHEKKSPAIPGHDAGARMAFAAPSTIYLASGDYAWDNIYGSLGPEPLAQRPDTDYGKVIAINLASRQAKVYSNGIRNMQGIAFDRHGQLWGVEHGLRGGDELNRITEGANFGWPKESLGTRYNSMPLPTILSYGRHDTYTAPTYAWLPSVAISSLTLIDGFHSAWDGDLLMATLRGQSLYRIRVKDDRVVFAEPIRIGKRIRYAHQHSDGRLVLWTDDKNLIFLTVADESATSRFIKARIARAGYNEKQRRWVESALKSCMVCHSIEPGEHANGPSLASIYGAPIAATEFPGYSEALRNRRGRWTRTELMAYLRDPAAYVPGTVMPNTGIEEPFVLDALLDLLEALKTTAE